MALINVTVFYLEMLAPSPHSVYPPRSDLEVIHSQHPTVAEYRTLYNAVGKDYHWYSRGQLSDTKLAEILANPLNEIHVLHVEGETAGFAELDRRVEREIELVQFGLMPEFLGMGLGKWFLRWTIDQVWSYQPERFWLHTCTLDHPAALPNYLKAGLTVYKEEKIQREI